MATITYESLLDEVLKRNQRPEDRHEITAILESLGWNDTRASQVFGVADVFELAEALWERCKTKVLYTAFSKVENLSLPQMALLLLRQFLRGVIFAVPMAISVVSMLTLKFSLWSYENLSVELATSIAIGTILSFVTVGGFTQAIARRGFFYIIQGYYNMARRITFHFIRLGFLICLLLSALIVLLNMLLHVFPFQMLVVIILYFFFLNTIWLSVTVMYILKKELLFTGLILCGIGVVFLLFDLLGVNIIVAQLIALSIVSVVSILLVIYLFKRAERRAEKGISPQLPKMSVTLYSTLPYFIYGCLYFSFLFVDRIIAWSRNTEFMPYLIWFRGEYELGLDFALLVLIIPMGISEVVLTKMMMDIEISQKSYWGDEADRMNRHYIREYFRRLVQIMAIGIVSALALYWLLVQLFDRFPSLSAKSLFSIPQTEYVFVVALVAYVLISAALMNAVILFSLSQPEFVVRSIWIAMLVNVGTGFLLSRWVDYIYAVYGLLFGSIVFLVLSCIQVVRVLRKLDYYLYAAS
ncbi:hypothetical protein [Paenibacillus thermotolerans]|uniref:hypothetical protein n=1 Tax=Paenibacillus thermotolerans TaxID=3027807 RepID=UPI0023682888|nr:MULTISPECIES: hypothetical protein [unclassified Paenibacillus]